MQNKNSSDVLGKASLCVYIRIDFRIKFWLLAFEFSEYDKISKFGNEISKRLFIKNSRFSITNACKIQFGKCAVLSISPTDGIKNKNPHLFYLYIFSRHLLPSSEDFFVFGRPIALASTASRTRIKQTNFKMVFMRKNEYLIHARRFITFERNWLFQNYFTEKKKTRHDY